MYGFIRTYDVCAFCLFEDSIDYSFRVVRVQIRLGNFSNYPHFFDKIIITVIIKMLLAHSIWINDCHRFHAMVFSFLLDKMKKLQ